MPTKPRVIVAATCLALVMSTALAQTRQCAHADVSVTYQNADDAALACDAAAQAKALFAQCAVPQLSRPIHIDIIDEMTRGCVGLYHCGEDRIEVLAPQVLQSQRDPDSGFAHLTLQAYFQSIVVHELAHAATDGMPCPYESCYVGPEYIGYLMQVMSLAPADLVTFEGGFDMTAPVTIEDLNPFILALVPDKFAQHVWGYHWQRDDPCDFVTQLIRGEAILDFAFYNAE